MKKIFCILLIASFLNCSNYLKENNSALIFKSNTIDFINFKNTAFENFEYIVNSDECYPNRDTSKINITLKYLENCNTGLEKEIFDNIHTFLSEFSIESAYLEKNKLVLVMKVLSNINKTKYDIIVFSYDDEFPSTYSEGVTFKKEIQKNWYHLIQEEPSF